VIKAIDIHNHVADLPFSGFTLNLMIGRESTAG
jgi:hypothetical protein